MSPTDRSGLRAAWRHLRYIWETSEMKSLRSQWNYLGWGRKIWAWMRLLEVLCCKNISSRAIFKVPLIGANPASAFIKWMQAPQDMRTINPWRCLRLSGLFSWITTARPRVSLLEAQSRACHSHPPEEPGAAGTRNRIQRCCQRFQGFEVPTGGLPGAGSIFVPK